MSTKETKETKEVKETKQVEIKQLSLKESLRLGPIATTYFNHQNTSNMILITNSQLIAIKSNDFKEIIYVPLSNVQSFTLKGE